MGRKDEESSSDGVPYKLAVVVRPDLGMTTGKLAAQVGHAVHDAVAKCKKARLKAWEDDGSMIVVLQAEGEDGLRSLNSLARKQGVAAFMQEDEGLTEIDNGSCTALSVGPDESEKVNLVTGRLSLFSCPKEAEIAELRGRLQQAEAELARLRPLPSTPAILRDGEVWLALDLEQTRWTSGWPRAVVPEMFEQWRWEGELAVLPFKWDQAVEECCENDVALCARKPWEAPGFDQEGICFLTHRSETCGIAVALALGEPTEKMGLIAGWGVQPGHRRKGLGRCLLRLCLERHAELGRARVLCAISESKSPEAWRLLSSEGFRAVSKPPI